MTNPQLSSEAPTYHAVVTAVFFVAGFSSGFFSLLPSSLEAQVIAVILAWVFLALGIFALIGGFVGKAARRKGRSFHTFFWLSLLVNPLIMAIVVAAISPAGRSYPPADALGPSNELERLAHLHRSGSITDSEFAAAKKKLLSTE